MHKACQKTHVSRSRRQSVSTSVRIVSQFNNNLEPLIFPVSQAAELTIEAIESGIDQYIASTLSAFYEFED